MFLEQPSGEILQRISKQLNENVDTRDKDLAYIKEWLRQEPHLPDELDDAYVLSFLRSCKFSLEKCKRKLDMYFTVRATVPEFFKNRVLTRFQLHEILDTLNMFPLPTTTSDGYRVHIIKFTSDKLLTMDVSQFLKLCFMIADVRLRVERSAADIYVIDVAGMKPKHLIKFPLHLMRKLFLCLQEAYPLRVQAMHYVNVTVWIEKFVETFKPLLKEKLRKRVHAHSNIKTLFDYVPQEILPQEYGGTVGTVADHQDKWIEELFNNMDWFAEQEDVVADESRRIDKSTNYEEMFGTHGSFRQLVLD